MDESAHHVASGRRPPRSLRRLALIVTGISGGIALVAGLLTSFYERTDPTHGLVNAGWLSFPAGLVAAGGLMTVLYDVLATATTSARDRNAAGLRHSGSRRPGGVLMVGVLVYAIYLLVGALAVIAFTLYRQAWPGLATDVFLLLCAAVFLWGVRHLGEPAGSPGQETHTGHELESSAVRSVEERQFLRRWAVALTGGGAGLAITMLLLSLVSFYLQDTGIPYGLLIFAGFGFMIAAGGLLLVVVDGLLRLSERRSS
jgi:MFS family permease